MWAGVEIDKLVLSGRHCARVEEKMVQTSPEVASLLVTGMYGAKNTGVHAGKTQARVTAGNQASWPGTGSLREITRLQRPGLQGTCARNSRI